jgi:hypothetical protein
LDTREREREEEVNAGWRRLVIGDLYNFCSSPYVGSCGSSVSTVFGYRLGGLGSILGRGKGFFF